MFEFVVCIGMVESFFSSKISSCTYMSFMHWVHVITRVKLYIACVFMFSNYNISTVLQRIFIEI